MRVVALTVGVMLLAVRSGTAVVVPQVANPTFEASSQVVHLWATVRGPRGEPITDLRREDFTIRDGGQDRSIEIFVPPSEASAEIIDTALFLDTSRRMANDIGVARKVAVDFVERLPSNVVLFTDLWSKATAADKSERVREWAAAATPSGYNALYDAIASVLMMKASKEGTRRLLVVAVTDGVDEASACSSTRLAELLLRANATFYAAQFPGNPQVARARDVEGRAAMRHFAKITGGSVVPVDPSHPTAALAGVLSDFQASYRLGFPPTPGKKFRRVKVRVARPHLEIRYRDGYYPPEAPR